MPDRCDGARRSRRRGRWSGASGAGGGHRLAICTLGGAVAPVACCDRVDALARADRALGGRLAAAALLTQGRIAVVSHEGERGACARQQFVGHPCGRATMSWLNVSRERETSEREHDLTFRNRPGSTPAKLRAACLTAKAMDGDRAGTRAAVRRVRPLDRYTGACARPPNPAPPQRRAHRRHSETAAPKHGCGTVTGMLNLNL